MKNFRNSLFLLLLTSFALSCASKASKQSAGKSSIGAKEILGDSNYLSISYGGYRQKTREIQPTIAQIKEDLQIMSAMGIKVLRTYNVHLEEASNILKAITELKQENPRFEMYVMLGAWIDCKNAWTANPDHFGESERNAVEIARAVELTKQYPDIVKIIAVGNEAMVKWASAYHVQAGVILKWVNHLQELKKKGELPQNVWITSSDNFAAWGGGTDNYKTDDLVKLINAVDYVSMHTYPMHETHYNPQFWGVLQEEEKLSEQEKIDAAMARALNYAISQYDSVKQYLKSIGVTKPIHIGETGWADHSNEFYGNNGSKATDEYKAAVFYKQMRAWTNKAGISCFYFEAFDEQWKDAKNPEGSENHFGLINLQGQAKYVLWDLVDKGVFKGLKRDGQPISKTFNGNSALMWKEIQAPPTLVKKK
jgi:exo-beta-1,3-glucanase (GH17 family)